jgi:hypothetical protein
MGGFVEFFYFMRVCVWAEKGESVYRIFYNLSLCHIFVPLFTISINYHNTNKKGSIMIRRLSLD